MHGLSKNQINLDWISSRITEDYMCPHYTQTVATNRLLISPRFHPTSESPVRGSFLFFFFHSKYVLQQLIFTHMLRHIHHWVAASEGDAIILSPRCRRSCSGVKSGERTLPAWEDTTGGGGGGGALCVGCVHYRTSHFQALNQTTVRS